MTKMEDLLEVPFEEKTSSGEEYLLGRLELNRGTHRDLIIPKMENRVEALVRKMRDQYLKTGYMPPEIPIIQIARKRDETDTI